MNNDSKRPDVAAIRSTTLFTRCKAPNIRSLEYKWVKAHRFANQRHYGKTLICWEKQTYKSSLRHMSSTSNCIGAAPFRWAGCSLSEGSTDYTASGSNPRKGVKAALCETYWERQGPEGWSPVRQTLNLPSPAHSSRRAERLLYRERGTEWLLPSPIHVVNGCSLETRSNSLPSNREHPTPTNYFTSGACSSTHQPYSRRPEKTGI